MEFNCGDKSQIVVALGKLEGLVIDYRGVQGNFWGNRSVLHLDLERLQQYKQR